MQYLKYLCNISNLAKHIKGKKRHETLIVKHVRLTKGLTYTVETLTPPCTTQTIKF